MCCGDGSLLMSSSTWDATHVTLAVPVVEAAAVVAAAVADIAVADKAAAHTVHCHIPGTAVAPGQHSTPPTALPAPVAATADVVRTLAMPSSMHSAHPQTCLQTAPETSECLAAVLQLADLEEGRAYDALDQQDAAGCRAEAGVVKLSDHHLLVEYLRWCHAVGRSVDGGTADHTETAVETARCPAVVEAEADGRLFGDVHSVVVEEEEEHSWQDTDVSQYQHNTNACVPAWRWSLKRYKP